jgi:hypothetical protein
MSKIIAAAALSVFVVSAASAQTYSHPAPRTHHTSLDQRGAPYTLNR